MFVLTSRNRDFNYRRNMDRRILISSAVIVVIHIIHCVSARQFSRCEFAQTILSFQPNIDYDDLNHWICIVQRTNLNSSAITENDESAKFYGIFQLNDQHVCASEEADLSSRLCEAFCDKFVDDQLKDDFECSQKIFVVEAEESGNGFNAWPANMIHCQNDIVIDWLHGCYIDNVLTADLNVRDKGTAPIEPRKR